MRAERQGWIKFGEPAFELALKDPIRRAIQPVPGRLVLFPSYMWHGTVPFRDAQARTTIALTWCRRLESPAAGVHRARGQLARLGRRRSGSASWRTA